MITFDEKLEAAWGLHKIEKHVLEKEIAELRAENEKLKAAFRVNMLRAFSHMSHEEIDAEIAAAILEGKDK